MKTTTILLGMLLAFAVLITPLVSSSAEMELNCSYFNNTPDSGAIMVSGGDAYRDNSIPYSSIGNDDISFEIDALINANNTYDSWLIWDGGIYTASSTTDDRNTTMIANTTGLANTTIVVSNETDESHTYYMKFGLANATNVANISGCQSGFTCEVSSGYVNISCPTRTVTLDYRVSGALPDDEQQGIVEEEESFVEKNLISIIGIVVLLVGIMYFKK